MSAAATLRPYRIKCAGLEYTALAHDVVEAIFNAMAQNGARGVSAKPLVPRGTA